jgi:uncharacterized protein
MTEDMGGDPACWLHRVCEACGTFIDHDEDGHVCPFPADPSTHDTETSASTASGPGRSASGPRAP